MTTARFFMKATVAALLTMSTAASAQNISLADHFTGGVLPQNAGGGLTHLADGDLVGITSDFVSGPALVRFDGNNDGIPAGGSHVFVSFDTSAFGNFVQASPSGKYALAGLSGSDNTVYHLDTATGAVKKLLDVVGSYDLVFVDETHAYLSSNPGGFDPSVPNDISFLDLSTGTPFLAPVIQIPGTPSGPIALNDRGDLYYVKNTFAFPAPANSIQLLRFSASKLASARAGGAVLTEQDADIRVPLTGGYDLAYHKTANGGELFVSTIANTLLRVPEDTLLPETFLTVNDPTAPALTALSFYKPEAPFDPAAPSPSEIAVSLTTDFFSTYSIVQVRTDTFDRDDDNFIDAVDQCPLDAAKLLPGECGCGQQETDSNADAIPDCGAPRSFSTSLAPRFGLVSGGVRTIDVLLERVLGNKVSYSVEVRGPDGKRKTKRKSSSSNALRFKKLKPGIYQVRFQARAKQGRRTSRSLFSETVVVRVS